MAKIFYWSLLNRGGGVKKKRSAAELRELSFHLAYELRAVYEIPRVLRKLPDVEFTLDERAVIRNSLKEAFSIHANNVVAFFSQDDPRFPSAKQYTDDSFAEGLLLSFRLLFLVLRNDVARHIARFTWDRVDNPIDRETSYGPEGYQAVLRAVATLVSLFYDVAPPEYISDTLQNLILCLRQEGVVESKGTVE